MSKLMLRCFPVRVQLW